MATRPYFKKKVSPERPYFKKKVSPERPYFKKKEYPPRPTPKKEPLTIMKRKQPLEKEPLTIMKRKQPIEWRRKGKPVPPPLPKPINWTPLSPKPIKPAPGRSPKLKWNIKKR